jgi:2-keto-3-deoxy-galactonokinase
LKLSDYFDDLTKTLKLSDDEKSQIESYYYNDGSMVQNILNNDSLSPFQQAQQVAAIRDTRNAKIETLLQDDARKREFEALEARYRVALTELAANGGWVSAPPAPAPAPAPAAAAIPAPAPAK